MQPSSLTRPALIIPGGPAWPQWKKDECVVCAALVVSSRAQEEAASVAGIGLMALIHPIESPLLRSQARVRQGMKRSLLREAGKMQ